MSVLDLSKLRCICGYLGGMANWLFYGCLEVRSESEMIWGNELYLNNI